MTDAPKFTKSPNELICDHELSPSALRVYLAVAMYARQELTAYPSRQTIADAIGMSVRNVARAIHELRGRGWLAWEQQTKSKNGRSSNCYTVRQSLEVEDECVPYPETDPSSTTVTDPSSTPGQIRPLPQDESVLYLGTDMAHEEDAVKKTHLSRRSEADAALRAACAAAASETPPPGREEPTPPAPPVPAKRVIRHEPESIPFPDRATKVFIAWRKSVTLHPKLPDEVKRLHLGRKLTNPRRAAVDEVLREHSLDEVLAAAEGWIWDDWEKRPEACDFVTILTSSKFEKFVDWHTTPASRPQPPKPRTGLNGHIVQPKPKEFWDNITEDQMRLLPKRKVN